MKSLDLEREDSTKEARRVRTTMMNWSAGESKRLKGL